MQQEQVPLVQALKQHVHRGSMPMHTPGHKQGEGAPEALREAWGREIWRWDLTELPGLDNLAQPRGAIARAQELAAHAFGARECRFLVNGSSVGVMSMVAGVCAPGEVIVLPRQCHRSALAGLILSGARPYFVWPRWWEEWDLPLPPAAEQWVTALQQVPEARAVLAVQPNYQGLLADLSGLKAYLKAHAGGAMLLADEAHGAHLPFYAGLPPSALSQGADLVVTSLHKTGLSLTQSALLLRGEAEKCSWAGVGHWVRLLQTSSPSYLLLASLDAARREMALAGEGKWGQWVRAAEEMRRTCHDLGIPTPGPGSLPPGWFLDPMRLTIHAGAMGWEGVSLARWFREQGVEVEMADARTVICLLGPDAGSREKKELGSMLRLLSSLARGRRGRGEGPVNEPEMPVPEAALSPREAFLRPRTEVALSRSAGRVSAGIMAVEPPGIPLLVPGEVITPQIRDHLLWARAKGRALVGLGAGQTVSVVA